MFVEVPYGHPLPPIRCPYVEKRLWVGYTASFRLLFPVQLPRALLTRFLLSPGIRNIWAFSLAVLVATIRPTPNVHHSDWGVATSRMHYELREYHLRLREYHRPLYLLYLRRARLATVAHFEWRRNILNYYAFE